jgi:hypothetical protein
LKTRFSLRTLIALTTCIAILVTAFVWLVPGVKVTVRNSGVATLQDLQVHVTGQSYALGDLASGAVKQCTVHSNGESHVEISYRLEDGTKIRHTVDCYLESGSRGTIHAEFQDGELLNVSQNINMALM